MVCTFCSARLNALCLSGICLIIYHRIWKVLFWIRPVTLFLCRQNAHQDMKTPMKLKTSHRRKGIEPSPSREDSSHLTTVSGCCHSAKGRSAHFAFFWAAGSGKKLVCNYVDEAWKTNELKNFDSEDLFERREPASKSKLWRIGPARTILEQTWNFLKLNQQNVSLSRSV